MKSLGSGEMLAIQVSERTMSVLSLAGSLFIITTFLRWHYFRKPINRLVFYASFGNMMANVASLISTSALPTSPNHFSSLCEFQGILIQWFMMADSLWVFCMAFNVMLVFFYGFNSRQLRHLEKWYLIAAYGCPGLVAIIYLILDHYGPQKIIGPAVLWCWVSSEVEWMRIAFFYGPVWVAVISTFVIYIITGRQIYKKRAELRSFSKRATFDQESGNTFSNPFTADDFRNIKVETEMKVETHSQVDRDSDLIVPTGTNESRSSFSSTKQLSNVVEVQSRTASPENQFSHVNWAPGSTHISSASVARPEDTVHNGYRATAFSNNRGKVIVEENIRSISISHSKPNIRRTAALEGNAAAWGYFKVAFLMFAALFIVWVPSTVNRLQQIIHKDHSIFWLNLASALVLPLQGFWNSMIYISTTWSECKRALAETVEIFSSASRRRKSASSARDSDRTLATSDSQEFETPIALDTVTSDAESQHLQTTRSSSEIIGIAVSAAEKR